MEQAIEAAADGRHAGFGQRACVVLGLVAEGVHLHGDHQGWR